MACRLVLKTTDLGNWGVGSIPTFSAKFSGCRDAVIHWQHQDHAKLAWKCVKGVGALA